MVTDVKRADFCFVQSSLECHVFLVLVLASVWPRGSVTMVMMMMIGHHHKVGHDLFNYTGCLSMKIFKKKQDLITTTIIWPQVCVCVYTPVVLDSFWKFSKSNCYGNFWSRIKLTTIIYLLSHYCCYARQLVFGPHHHHHHYGPVWFGYWKFSIQYSYNENEWQKWLTEYVINLKCM